MNLEQLKEYDGRDGRKAYVAIAGKIYDFTSSPLWTNGDHQGAHKAGTDLTEELKSAPHVRAVIERFPVVDALEETPLKKKSFLLWLILALAGLGLLGILAL